MNDIDRDNLIRNLPYIRAILGESSASFAEKLGVSRATYQNIETGKSQLTTLYWHAINNLIKELYVQDAAMWTYTIPLTMESFYNGDGPCNLIRQTIDEAATRVGRKCGVKCKQKAIIKALDERSEEIGNVIYLEHQTVEVTV